MSAKGNCYDNAAMESFYGRYKTSSVRKQVFAGEEQARRNAFEYIEQFYNRFRKHSSLGYKNPVQFEEEYLPPRGGQITKPGGLSKNRHEPKLPKQLENSVSGISRPLQKRNVIVSFI